MKPHRWTPRLLAGAGLCALVCLRAPDLSAQDKTSRGTVQKVLTRGGAELSPEAAGPGQARLTERRAYWLHLPPGYDGQTRLPLVVAFHPRGSTGPRFERITGWSQKADREKFIVVYPDASGNPRTWNAGYLSGQPVDRDEVFFAALLDQLQKELAIDPKRIYLTGQVSGAMMAYWLAAAFSERVAAVGVVSGAVGVRRWNGQVETLSQPAQPVSVLSVHGQHNQIIPYKGGRSRFSGRRYLSVERAREFWAEANGCPDGEPKFEVVLTTGGAKLSAEDAKREIYETEHLSKVKVFREVYSGCKGGVEVVFYGINQGNHKWPGGLDLRPRGWMSPQEVKATDLIWEFFAKHPKP
jgi:polyhydroxybutyrate depolymerase